MSKDVRLLDFGLKVEYRMVIFHCLLRALVTTSSYRDVYTGRWWDQNNGDLVERNRTR